MLQENMSKNDSMTHTGRGQSTHQIATRSAQSFLHVDRVISRVGMSASCLVAMNTIQCDRQTDMTMKTRCSTEVAQRKMNRPINSGKRVESIDRVDRFSAESSRSTESTKVESIDRVDRFSVELSRFVRLDRFQGLPPDSR